MSKVVYSVAMSLDGFIAAEDGSYDWILIDPDIDFSEIMNRFDTLLMGRKTFEMMQGQPSTITEGMTTVVFSSTLKPDEYPGTRIEKQLTHECVAKLRERSNKDLWLFGGGELFRSFVEIGEVDIVSVAIVPVLLGNGLPILPPPTKQLSLKLVDNQTFSKTGTVCLDYAVSNTQQSAR